MGNRSPERTSRMQRPLRALGGGRAPAETEDVECLPTLHRATRSGASDRSELSERREYRQMG